jgi:hypothetical protein
MRAFMSSWKVECMLGRERLLFICSKTLYPCFASTDSLILNFTFIESLILVLLYYSAGSVIPLFFKTHVVVLLLFALNLNLLQIYMSVCPASVSSY